MPGYSTKIHRTHNKLIIGKGGTLVLEKGAAVQGFNAAQQGAAVADAAGDAPTAAEFNALLAALRTAGVIATAATE